MTTPGTTLRNNPAPESIPPIAGRFADNVNAAANVQAITSRSYRTAAIGQSENSASVYQASRRPVKPRTFRPISRWATRPIVRAFAANISSTKAVSYRAGIDVKNRGNKKKGSASGGYSSVKSR